MKILVASSVLCALTLVGCVLSPLDQSKVDPAAVDFAGYTVDANKAITIEAFDQRSNGWVTIATTISGNTQVMTWAERAWYEWNAGAVNTNNPHGTCIWGTWNAAQNICLRNAADRARFKVLGGLYFVSFRDGFMQCIQSEIDDGESQGQATWNCKSPSSPELRLSKL